MDKGVRYVYLLCFIFKLYAHIWKETLWYCNAIVLLLHEFSMCIYLEQAKPGTVEFVYCHRSSVPHRLNSVKLFSLFLISRCHRGHMLYDGTEIAEGILTDIHHCGLPILMKLKRLVRIGTRRLKRFITQHWWRLLLQNLMSLVRVLIRYWKNKSFVNLVFLGCHLLWYCLLLYFGGE